MQNVFDTDNYPDKVPSDLHSGNRWAWTRSDITSVYETASYTLLFRLSLLAEPFSDFTITAGKVSSAHVVEESQADTGGYPVGDYEWQAVIVRDSDAEEVTVDRGFLSIHADLGSSPGDARSWVYTVLQNVRATIQGTATEKQSSYSIGGRALSLRTPEELLDLEREFARRWKEEKAEADRKAGRSTNSRVLIQMGA
jgi:hypothetical protein